MLFRWSIAWRNPYTAPPDGRPRLLAEVVTPTRYPPPVLQDHGYHCPRCGQDLFYRNDNDDEATAIYLCSNPRCPFQIGAHRHLQS